MNYSWYVPVVFCCFLTHQRPYHCLTDRVIFFYQVFDSVRQWPHHGLTDQSFFNHFFDLGRQWPYHRSVVWSLTSQSKISFLKKPSLTDCGMATDILIENDLKKMKKTRSVRPWCGHWQTGTKTWEKKNNPFCQTAVLALAG